MTQLHYVFYLLSNCQFVKYDLICQNLDQNHHTLSDDTQKLDLCIEDIDLMLEKCDLFIKIHVAEPSQFTESEV